MKYLFTLLLTALFFVPTIGRAQGPVTEQSPQVIHMDGTQPITEPTVYYPPQDAGDFERLNFRASYLYWWIEGNEASLPLLTTGGAGRGILGQPDTVVLLTAGDVGETGPYHGAEFGAHAWLDADQWVGVDVQFFFLAKTADTFTAAGDSSGSPLLSIPFTDTNAAKPGASFTQIANPGVSTGQVRFENSTRLWGLELSTDLPSFACDRWAISSLVGFRNLDFTETFSIVQDVTSVGGQQILSFQGNAVPGTDSLRIIDDFNNRTQFYGVNVIVRADYQLTPAVTLNLTGKTALGANKHTGYIAGSTAQLRPSSGTQTVIATANGGLFAQPNNISKYTQSTFGVLPEVQAKVSWAVTGWAEISAGYTFLYWNRVARPADQIPGTINTTTAPSQATFNGGGTIPGRPDFVFTDLVIHGANVGVVVRY